MTYPGSRSSRPTEPVSGEWVRWLGRRPGAAVRLICFPAAGSGPAMFRGWPALLPEWIEPYAVALPGREARVSEPPIEDYRAAVAALATAVRPMLDGPCAFLGHSMGAHLAYGVAAALVDSGAAAPDRLFLSATQAPGRYAERRPAQLVGDQQLIDALISMGGTNSEVFADPELTDIVLSAYRADLHICASVDGPAAQPLPMGFSVFGGDTDADVPTESLSSWRPLTGRDYRERVFAGGHFYLAGPSQPEVVRAVTNDLALALSARRP